MKKISMPPAIPSVTGGKSPAIDFAAALNRGNPAAESIVRDLYRQQKYEENKETSLADIFLAETYNLPKRLGLSKHQAKAIEPILMSYRNDLRKAHRFVLDEDFIRFATETSSRMPAEKLLARLQYAVLPYETMWIEFDLMTKVKVMREVHGLDPRNFNWNEVADRLGLILRRLSDTEAVVEMVCETFGDHGMVGTTICYFYSVREYNFTKKDGKGTGCRPFHLDPETEAKARATGALTADETTAQIGAASLWGYGNFGGSMVIEKMVQMKQLRLPSFLLRHGVLGTGRMKEIMMTFVEAKGMENVSDVIANLMVQETTEFTGMMRWIAVVLSFINEVPVSKHLVKPEGTIRTGLTNRRPKMDYHKLVLKVPKKKPIQFIERVFATGRKMPLHDVMQHWRTYEDETSCKRDEHEWEYDWPERYRLCGKCMAFSRLIPEHVRGDAAVGVHRKDYVVKHDE